MKGLNIIGMQALCLCAPSCLYVYNSVTTARKKLCIIAVGTLATVQSNANRNIGILNINVCADESEINLNGIFGIVQSVLLNQVVLAECISVSIYLSRSNI